MMLLVPPTTSRGQPDGSIVKTPLHLLVRHYGILGEAVDTWVSIHSRPVPFFIGAIYARSPSIPGGLQTLAACLTSLVPPIPTLIISQGVAVLVLGKVFLLID
jgi:hypothetical protein